MLRNSVLDCINQTPLVYLPTLSARLEHKLYMKLEALNPGGSMKDRVALHCIKRAEERGELKPGSVIIESTSGSLGIALALVGRRRDYEVICVVDPKVTKETKTIMHRLGAKLVEVKEADAHGGYLAARIEMVKRLLAVSPRSWWFNQYENKDAPEAHYLYTAKEIAQDLPGGIDWIVCPVGTGGLLSGLLRYYREDGRTTKVMGVDAVGSVVLGGTPGPRRLVGIGSMRKSSFFSAADLDATVYVKDEAAFQAAHLLAEIEGVFVGGSSGAALAGLMQCPDKVAQDSTVVIVAPDGGVKYLDTLYDDCWLNAE